MKQALIVDGNNTFYRCYWANKDLKYNGKGTGGIYGFFRTLITIIKMCIGNGQDKLNVLVVFDEARRDSWRHKYVDILLAKGMVSRPYKDRVPFEPDVKKDIDEQKYKVQLGLRCLGINCVASDSYEADDIIGYCVDREFKAGKLVTILSGDKDFYQLLKDNVRMISRADKGFYTEQDFIKEWGIEPKLWVEVGALCGDKSDTIEAVRGIGEKTAIKLIKQFGTSGAVVIEAENDNIPGVLGERIVSYKEKIPVAKKLKRILTDASVMKNANVYRGTKNFKSFNSLLKDSWGIRDINILEIQHIFGGL